MTLIGGRARILGTTPRLIAILVAIIAVGGCSTSTAPVASTAATLPTVSADATAPVTPSLAPSPSPPPSPSPSVAIVKVTPIPGGADSKVVVHLVVGRIQKIGTTLTAWDRIAISAPAGKVWHVSIDNQEKTILHNFAVASGPTFPERIFETPKYPTGTHAFDIPALPAGSYLFICTLHPNVMTGTLTIE